MTSSHLGRPPPSRIHLENSTPRRCRSVEAAFTGATHAANVPLRRWCVGLRAFVLVVVVECPTWFGQIGGLERRRKKKTVSRGLRRRRVWHTRHFSVLDLMVEMKEEEGSQWTPSSAARVAHASPFLSGSDGRDQGVWKDKGGGNYLNIMGNEGVKAAFK
ncbi:hypothetical protein Cgig2_002264 [Carnegiea gigantea]|uniref:Uncharacterized protein n=1 Tax=Carnegiea gigantea TaxID=171969 RepID=A0A9Q1QLW2_9CARY|nr:hypothetical protein Cgig2_019264 [Carnegiea gigantea]KAJ8449467.1 hypothetical protein Cgig2_002264 [Carnegiea gigantea]